MVIEQSLTRKLDWEKSIQESLAQSDVSIRCYVEVPSTMSVARDLSALENPLIVLAENQTNGVGRRGQPWHPSPQSLYVTLCFEIASEHDCSLMPLAAGVAILKALEITPGELYLKWPNDIYSSNGLKLGGILIEKYAKLDISKDSQQVLAIGIGLNLRESPKDLQAECVENIKARVYSPPDIVARLFPVLESMVSSCHGIGFLDILDDWNAFSYPYGTAIAGIVDGKEISGRYQGIDDNGQIKIEMETLGTTKVGTFSSFEIKSLKLK